MKSFDVSCPYCDESLSVTSGDMGIDVTCPTCSEVFFIEKESPDETKKSFKEPAKPNPPKKYHQEKTKKTFVVKNWMLYAGYYVILILIPIIMIALAAFFGSTGFGAVGLSILGFGVMNLANSLSLYLGMQVCRVGCEVPAIILMSLIASLWGTFVGPGGLIIFLFLFSKYTDASIMGAVGTVICSSIISVFVYLGLMGVILQLVSGLGQ
jgi:phage FluMu protein Com